MKRLVRIAIVADVAIAIFLITLAIWLGAEWLGAAATAIQAVFIVAALAVAAGTLLSDSRDRRVDRVIALHSELTSGELQEARIRFVNHLRRHGCHGRVRQVYRHELATDRSLSRYRGDRVHKPREDLNRILRFFERVEATHVTGSLYEPLLVELIGRHAAWMNLAIRAEGDEVPRKPLSNLGNWADEYVKKHGHKYSYLSNWGANRRRDFGVN